MTAQDYLERYKQLTAIEQSKDELIKDLLQRVTELEDAYDKQKLDHEREKRFNREIQIHEMKLMDQITRIRAIMDRKPYVIVLLDGDGMIFKEEYLQQGEKGGQNAAKLLHDALQDFVESKLPTTVSPKIMVKLYVDVKGLNDLCVRGGLTSDPSTLEKFIRGFNGSIPMFDMVDIGTGRYKAHDKIGEIFTINLYNCHCRQIFLGCSQAHTYAELLNESAVSRELMGRVTLIEGIPFAKDMEAVKASYKITKFSQLFRNAKFDAISAPWKATVTAKPRPSATPSQVQDSKPLSRSSTNTTTTSNSLALSSKASNSGEFQVVRSKASGPSPPKTVQRNKYGQRIDLLDFNIIPREDMNRIKKLKLCNFYHLQGECPNENCQHDHSRKLSKSDHRILTAIARMTPCRFGTECDDVDCIYGHRCPDSEPGKKDCYWGSSCRFDPVAHGVDTTIVKVTKIT